MRQRTNVWSSSEKNMQRCAITKCNDYTSESLYKAFNEIIRNTDFPDVHGKKVLIKPNILSDALPEKAITTDARAIEVLLHILNERGAIAIYMPAMRITSKTSALRPIWMPSIKMVRCR